MKYIIILLTLLLTSCSVSNPRYIEKTIIVKSEYTIPESHDHFEVNGELVCLYLDEISFEEIDTLYIEYYK